MNIRKVLNDGKNIKKKSIIRFLINNGYRTPKEIWVGNDNFNNELTAITRKSLLSSIEMNNRVFTKHPELLNIE